MHDSERKREERKNGDVHVRVKEGIRYFLFALNSQIAFWVTRRGGETKREQGAGRERKKIRKGREDR